MNELLAIVIIVVVCCAIFFAWLLSMATCPDKMITWLNGTTSNSTSSTSYCESKELIKEDREENPVAVHTNQTGNAVYLHQMNNIARRSTSKKLSVVPEGDEQLTVTSISQILYPMEPVNYVNKNGNEAGRKLAAHFQNNDGVPEVVVVNGTSKIRQKVLNEETETEFNDRTVHFHYSLPAIHVT